MRRENLIARYLDKGYSYNTARKKISRTKHRMLRKQTYLNLKAGRPSKTQIGGRIGAKVNLRRYKAKYEDKFDDDFNYRSLITNKVYADENKEIELRVWAISSYPLSNIKKRLRDRMNEMSMLLEIHSELPQDRLELNEEGRHTEDNTDCWCGSASFYGGKKVYFVKSNTLRSPFKKVKHL